MDFRQTFVIGVSWDKVELIRFWVKSSKVKVTFDFDVGVKHGLAIASGRFSIRGFDLELRHL